jgi:hypothetical protein
MARFVVSSGVEVGTSVSAERAVYPRMAARIPIPELVLVSRAQQPLRISAIGGLYWLC